MPDCFISYAKEDEPLAGFVQSHLRAQQISVFMASVSLQPGQDWSNEIMTNLRSSSWVIFLCSRAACGSAYVQQELGAALATQKRLVPIVWDMAPSQLPGWVDRKQALDLRGGTWQDLAGQVARIAGQIKSDNLKGALIAGAVLVGLLWLASKGE